MRFLTGPEIHTQVQRFSRRSGEFLAAVAYWGDGATERTGLSEKKNPKQVRIICDLLSGVCKPGEIKALMQRGICVRTLDRLHAKVWINGNDVILGSANASRNGLPGSDEDAAKANIEAAFLSRESSLSQELTRWFEGQWRMATEIDDRILDLAEDLWTRRRHSAKRAFTPTLVQKIRNPDRFDRFSRLRLVAYLVESLSGEAEQFLHAEGRRHYSDDEWQHFGDELPCYEWPLTSPEWKCRPGTVLMDFTCDTEGGEFSFNGFWQVRDCPTVTLTQTRLTLLTKLPHFDGHSLSGTEQQDIAGRICDFVAQRGNRTDRFDSYIDMDFLRFWDSDRPVLKRLLIAQVVDAARERCRTGRFDASLTFRAIRVCKDDTAWLSGYTTYVGGDIYQHGNHLKQEINREIGRRVKAAVGAEVVTGDNGRPATENVADEIIQSYTPFASYDPAAVAER